MTRTNVTGMVLIDLQKAFDMVDHDILCKKLEAMGIDFTDWFKSYLGIGNKLLQQMVSHPNQRL